MKFKINLQKSKAAKSEKIIGKILFLIAVLIFVSIGVSAYSIDGENCICENCTDCTDALNDSDCMVVKLDKDVINHNGTCIDNPENFNDKIFDCGGYTINGTNARETYGMYLKQKSGNVIRNCMVTYFYDGIYLDDYSSNNSLTNNTITSNNANGIYLGWHSSNNILNKNYINSNRFAGIRLQGSSNNNKIINNTIIENEGGIMVWDSSNNQITTNIANNNGIILHYSSNNNIANNSWSRIYLYDSPDNNLKNNTLNSFNIWGSDISHYYQNIGDSNTVNGKPIYYWTNKKNAPNKCKDIDVPEDAGFVAVVSCDNITVRNLNLSKNSYGILIVNTTNSNVLNNTATSNYHGIRLYYSSNNTLQKNKITNNIIGIYLYKSNSIISSNIVCNNTNSDFNSPDWQSSSGTNNTCDKPVNWNDTKKTGCTHNCSCIKTKPAAENLPSAENETLDIPTETPPKNKISKSLIIAAVIIIGSIFILFLLLRSKLK